VSSHKAAYHLAKYAFRRGVTPGPIEIDRSPSSLDESDHVWGLVLDASRTVDGDSNSFRTVDSTGLPDRRSLEGRCQSKGQEDMRAWATARRL
jgi:hypothetical protein